MADGGGEADLGRSQLHAGDQHPVPRAHVVANLVKVRAGFEPGRHRDPAGVHPHVLDHDHHVSSFGHHAAGQDASRGAWLEAAEVRSPRRRLTEDAQRLAGVGRVERVAVHGARRKGGQRRGRDEVLGENSREAVCQLHLLDPKRRGVIEDQPRGLVRVDQRVSGGPQLLVT